MENIQELPLYVCHKEVHALKIKCIRELPNSCDIFITPEDVRYPEFMTSTHRRPMPQAGWYYIVYPDGYYSYSPAAAFEEGYTRKHK